jgi:hypothetical protein
MEKKRLSVITAQIGSGNASKGISQPDLCEVPKNTARRSLAARKPVKQTAMMALAFTPGSCLKLSLRLTCPSFCTTASGRVYIAASTCEIGVLRHFPINLVYAL